MQHKALLIGSLAFAVSAVCAVAVGCSSSSSPAPAAVVVPVRVANGQMGAWRTLSPLPVPRANHCSVVANGYLVVIGGNYKPKGAADFKNIAEVDVAKIAADGSLGPWTKAGSTPAALNSCTAVASGNTIVLLDGIYDTPAAGTSPYEGKPQVATLSDDSTLSAFALVEARRHARGTHQPICRRGRKLPLRHRWRLRRGWAGHGLRRTGSLRALKSSLSGGRGASRRWRSRSRS